MKRSSKNLLTIFVIFIISVIFFSTALGKATYYSALLTTSVTDQFPVKILNLIGKKTIEESIDIKAGDETIKSKVFRPNMDGRFPAVILSVGITPLSIDDPLLNRLGDSLAKMGVIAVIPNVVDREYSSRDDVSRFIRTFEYIENQPYVLKEKIGFVGFCVGGSLSLIAASNEQIKDDVAYLVLLSPYYDNFELTKAIILEEEQTNSGTASWIPAELTRNVLINGLLAYLEDPIEADKIRDSVEGKVFLDGSDIENFSDDGKLVYRTLSSKNSDEFDQVFSEYPQRGKEDFMLLSPKNYISNLNPNTKIFILSDKQDTFVPRLETEAFRIALPDSVFVEIDSFEHVRPGTRLKRLSALTQGAKLYSFIHGILVEVYK